MVIEEVGVNRPRRFDVKLRKAADRQNFALTFRNGDATLVSGIAIEQLYRGRIVHLYLIPGQAVSVKLVKR